jgi:tellurite resistance protein TerC
MVEWYAWVGFIAAVAVLFAVDLGLFHRRRGVVHFSQALTWSGVWVFVGLTFALVVWAWLGGRLAGEYVAGYLIEWSLSVDNIFVFVLVFLAFAVPEDLRQRVLMWGVIGAVVLRLGFILGGAALLHTFSWTEYLFGGILLVTAARFLRKKESGRSIEESPVLRVFKRFVPITEGYRGSRYLVKEERRIAGTPLLAVLLLITVSDVIFAVDSIPAVFAVTQNAFVAFTSNALAVLGLRPLFFVLAGAVERFRYLKVSLAAVLGFVGLKLVLHQVVQVPTGLSLGVIALFLGTGIVASWIRRRRSDPPTVQRRPDTSPPARLGTG